MKLLKLSELEDLFSVSRTTIWNWRNDPNLKFPEPIKINKAILRFEESDINNWIRNRDKN